MRAALVLIATLVGATVASSHAVAQDNPWSGCGWLTEEREITSDGAVIATFLGETPASPDVIDLGGLGPLEPGEPVAWTFEVSRALKGSLDSDHLTVVPLPLRADTMTFAVRETVALGAEVAVFFDVVDGTPILCGLDSAALVQTILEPLPISNEPAFYVANGLGEPSIGHLLDSEFRLVASHPNLGGETRVCNLKTLLRLDRGRIGVVSLHGLDVVSSIDVGHGPGDATCSPDGSVVSRGRGEVAQIVTDHRTGVELFEGPVSHGSLLATDDHVFVNARPRLGNEKALYMIDRATGERRLLLAAESEEPGGSVLIREQALDANGRLAVVMTSEPSGVERTDVFVFDAATGEQLAHTTRDVKYRRVAWVADDQLVLSKLFNGPAELISYPDMATVDEGRGGNWIGPPPHGSVVPASSPDSLAGLQVSTARFESLQYPGSVTWVRQLAAGISPAGPGVATDEAVPLPIPGSTDDIAARWLKAPSGELGPATAHGNDRGAPTTVLDAPEPAPTVADPEPTPSDTPVDIAPEDDEREQVAAGPAASDPGSGSGPIVLVLGLGAALVGGAAFAGYRRWAR
ncbi:MAG: hypothetical protein AAF480_13775 [Actinomycetota bacterium]